MNRICPKCKENLAEYDHYFCSSCGSSLPKELFLKPDSIRIKSYDVESTSKKILFSFKNLKNNKSIYVAALILFILVVLFGIYTTGIFDLLKFIGVDERFVELERMLEERNPESKTIKIDSEELILEKGEFSKDKIASHFPDSVDFYFEAFDIKKLSEYFLQDEDLSNLFSRSEILFEKNFAGGYFEDYDAWAFAFVFKDKGLVEIVLEDIDDDVWGFKIVDGVLVMGHKDEIFSLFENVDSKVNTSLYQNPTYIKKTASLSESGSVKIIFMNDGNKDDISNYQESLDDNMKNVLIKVLDSSYDEVVIN